jgi:hypothetical protein
MAIDESFDVGIDTRTGVDDSYKLPFQFTGKIDKLTFHLGPAKTQSGHELPPCDERSSAKMC